MKKNKLRDFLINISINKINGLDKSIVVELANKSIEMLNVERVKLAKQMFIKKKVNVKESFEQSAEDIISKLQQIIEKGAGGKITLNNDEIVDVDVPTANLLVTLFNALDVENKKQMADVLKVNLEKFMKVVDFAYKNIR